MSTDPEVDWTGYTPRPIDDVTKQRWKRQQAINLAGVKAARQQLNPRTEDEDQE